MKEKGPLMRLLFPPKCVLCGKILPRGLGEFCPECAVDAPECPVSHSTLPFLDSWIAVWYYEGSVRRSLLRYKFYGARHYVHTYGRLLSEKLRQEYPEGFDILTWVPISPLRKLTRGFDQVQLLAEVVGQHLDMQPVPTLKKIRNNRPQSGIVGQAQRRANVLGVYRVTDPRQITGKRILLLDDIITTGATAGECARMLLTAGGEEVHCGAVASARRQVKKSR